MDSNEVKALGQEMLEIIRAGKNRREPLRELFQRYRIPDLNDELRAQAKACKAPTLMILSVSLSPSYSSESIAGRDVSHYHMSWEYLECCEALNVLVMRSVSMRSGNSRWGIKEESSESYELLTHEEAIQWIQQLFIPGDR
ncbi:MAG TPA: hypothetical protein VF723_14460 [Pyrinomonadaceae bacterium]|jgi:hypothetical protein